MIDVRYRNAFSEVYEILKYLREEDCKKIPRDVIEVIEENRNIDYVYRLKDNIELKDQELLPETRAILFNFFQDYFATERQKRVIYEWNRKEYIEAERLKSERYSTDVFQNSKKETPVNNKKENVEMIEYKETFFSNIINKIKKFLKLDK